MFISRASRMATITLIYLQTLASQLAAVGELGQAPANCLRQPGSALGGRRFAGASPADAESTLRRLVRRELGWEIPRRNTRIPSKEK